MEYAFFVQVEGRQLPLELKIAWKKGLGSGYSAISVMDGMAVTMFSDSTFDYALALNVEDGSELWRFKIEIESNLETVRRPIGDVSKPDL